MGCNGTIVLSILLCKVVVLIKKETVFIGVVMFSVGVQTLKKASATYFQG